MQKHPKITRERLDKFHSPSEWADVNVRSLLYAAREPVADVAVYSVPGRERRPLAAVLRQGPDVFVPAVPGRRYGPAWATHWFRLRVRVPAAWGAGAEAHLLWDATCEACVYRAGQPVQGLLGGSGRDRRAQYPLAGVAPGDTVELYIELAANGMFGVGRDGVINPVDPDVSYELKQCEVALFRREAWDFMHDLIVIADMAKELPEKDPRAAQALYVANAMQNAVWTDDPSTLTEGRRIAAKFLSQKNAEGAFAVTAIGNCHIDTAWLWPYAETRRKVVRSFASQLALLDQYAHHRFAASQAQQYAWLAEDQPALFNRVKGAIKDGRWHVVGGTWVEMDCNLPSGESFCRQFLHGQRFFREQFGHYCDEFWLPDTFGYSAQLPQIIRGAGMRFFLTQKLSWNNINRFPHHTFHWEGLDGSTVLTHFPPADTYCSTVSVKDVLYSQSNFKDPERSKNVMLLYGHGDGGGGPDASMLEMSSRMQRLQGLPSVETRSPVEFFELLEQENASAPLLTWSGELYFELHRGTYTSQARIKKGNRLCELLLRDVELWAATLCPVDVYPRQELDRLWKLVLLNQFHDVLPGSCIEEVAKDAHAHHDEVLEKAGGLLSAALDAANQSSQPSKRSRSAQAASASTRYYNSLGWNRTERLADGSLVTVGPFSWAHADVATSKGASSTTAIGRVEKESVILETAILRAVICTKTGQLMSLVHVPSGRESIKSGETGNVFCIFDDVNLFWDAWDAEVFHLEKRHTLSAPRECKVHLDKSSDQYRASVVVSMQLSDRSRLEQRIILTREAVRLDFETIVHWNENRRFLKVEFPTSIMQTAQATFETQFGWLQRPAIRNTSWDWAKFEVCAHRWCDLSEYGFGVALLNDCKYGYAVERNVMRLSLLRSPKAPDDTCDIGEHRFTYSLMPHAGSFQEASVIQEGYNLNCPLRTSTTEVAVAPPPAPLFKVSSAAVILETVKLAEDGSGDLILRLYEAYGSTAAFTLETSDALPWSKADLVNILEDPLPGADAGAFHFHARAKDRCFSATLTPFKLMTVRLSGRQ